MDQPRSHASVIMPLELRDQVTEFFLARGFTSVWLGLVSDGGEYVFSVLPSELAQVDVRAMTLELMKVTKRKIWIVGYGDRAPSEIFLES